MPGVLNVFIARLAFISLAFLVIFALFKCDMTHFVDMIQMLFLLILDPQDVFDLYILECFHVFLGGACAACSCQLVKGEMRVGSTMQLFPVAFGSQLFVVSHVF